MHEYINENAEDDVLFADVALGPDRTWIIVSRERFVFENDFFPSPSGPFLREQCQPLLRSMPTSILRYGRNCSHNSRCSVRRRPNSTSLEKYLIPSVDATRVWTKNIAQKVNFATVNMN